MTHPPDHGEQLDRLTERLERTHAGGTSYTAAVGAVIALCRELIDRPLLALRPPTDVDAKMVLRVYGHVLEGQQEEATERIGELLYRA